MPSIQEALVERNPWWRGELDLDYRPREILDRMEPFLDRPQILALTGLRRTGKTTIMLRLAERRIEHGLDPDRVVYFSFDEHPTTPVRDVVDAYEVLMDQDLRSGEHLVLLDEVQKHPGWQDEVKALYDLHKGRIKFVVSGSESLFIRQGSRESLAGRIFEFQVHQLTFREYLTFQGVSPHRPKLRARELRRAFEGFRRTQGFPELVGESDRRVIEAYILEGIVDRAVLRDLVTLLDIREPEALRALVNILLEQPGQMIKLSELAGELGISRQTLSRYLTYLEDGFLLRKLYNHAAGRRKVERKLKRYYPTVIHPALPFRTDTLSRSVVFEWLVVNQLRAEYFWRDKYQHEVDIVLSPEDGDVTPVEVKYGRVDLSGVERFLEKQGGSRGIVVTPDTQETRTVAGKTVELVPAWAFLLDPPA